jgi:hypothetical protein
MTTDLKDNGYAIDTIITEGLSYAVQDYCGAEGFEDPVTATLWAEASIALGQLETHLAKGLPEEYEDELSDRTPDIERSQRELASIAAR